MNYIEQKKHAMLTATGLFWLPSGMSYDDVLAAYQFKGVPTEADALTDVSGHGRTLTKHTQSGNTPTWNSDTGWTFKSAYQGNSGYLSNATLDGLLIRSAVVRFSDVSSSYNRTYLITAGGSNGMAQLMARSAIYDGESVKTYSGGGYASGTSGGGKWDTSSSYHADGVFGANFNTSGSLYYNGSSIGTTQRSATVSMNNTATFGNYHAGISELYNADHGGKKIQCAVFFGVSLTAEQHKEVAERMMAL